MFFNGQCYEIVREMCYVDKYERKLIKKSLKLIDKINKKLKKAAANGDTYVIITVPYELNVERVVYSLKIEAIQNGYHFQQWTANKYKIYR